VALPDKWRVGVCCPGKFTITRFTKDYRNLEEMKRPEELNQSCDCFR
jgi:hypothetical protein